ncbi:MAG: flagellar biosynthetic protein FliO [Kangiellaceae bacterium]|nr:flagellar biosynthetic protein FliO [Kangiellaceae bacterium]
MKRSFYHSLLVITNGIVFAVFSIGLNAAEKNKPVITMDPIDSIVPMLGGLVAILLVIFFLAYLFKKFSGFNIASQNIRVLETQLIGHKEKILIVEVHQQQFLIGVTSHTISQLGELTSTQADEPNDEADASVSASTSMGNNRKNSAFSKIMSTLTYTKGKQRAAENSEQETVK